MVQCLCVRQLSCLLRNVECGNIHINNVSSSEIKNIFFIILILHSVKMHTLTQKTYRSKDSLWRYGGVYGNMQVIWWSSLKRWVQVGLLPEHLIQVHSQIVQKKWTIVDRLHG